MGELLYVETGNKAFIESIQVWPWSSAEFHHDLQQTYNSGPH